MTPYAPRLLATSGTHFDIGFQHGAELREEVAGGMQTFLLKLWNDLVVERKDGGWFDRQFLKFASRPLQNQVTYWMGRGLPLWLRERILGLAEGSKSSPAELLFATLLPDFGPMLQVLLGTVAPNRFVQANAFTLGCSSFLYKNGERFLVGRNFDFPGVGYWEKTPVIQWIKAPHAIPFIAVTSAGVPLGGITGINAEWISVSIHQHYARSFRPSGLLPFAMAEEVLMRARSLDDALNLLAEMRPANAWAFVIADGKTKQGMVVERTPDRIGIRRLERDGQLCHSNYYLTPDCAEVEYSCSERMNWDNASRRNRLQQLLQAIPNGADAEAFLPALSDHYDDYLGCTKLMNRIVSQVFNLQSVLFDLDKRQLWMAVGKPPIHLGEYQVFDLEALLDGKMTAATQTVENRPLTPPIDHAKRLVVDGCIAAFDGDFHTAYHLSKSSLSDYLTPETAQVTGILAMKCGDAARAVEYFDAGLDDLDQRLDGKPRPPEHFELRLFKARALDLLGSRGRAAQDLKKLAEDKDLKDPQIRRIASGNRPYTQKQLNRLILPYSVYVPFQ